MGKDNKEKENNEKEKKKGLIGEFKEFVLRGSVIDMAVGIIIGASFQTIIKSLVDDIIMPCVTKFTGGVNFENWFISLDNNEYATLELAKEAGAATLNYGVFISAIIQFIIMAFAIFIMIKTMNAVSNKAKKIMKNEKVEEVTTKTCEFCQSEISVKAIRCPHCTSELK